VHDQSLLLFWLKNLLRAVNVGSLLIPKKEFPIFLIPAPIFFKSQNKTPRIPVPGRWREALPRDCVGRGFASRCDPISRSREALPRDAAPFSPDIEERFAAMRRHFPPILMEGHIRFAAMPRHFPRY